MAIQPLQNTNTFSNTGLDINKINGRSVLNRNLKIQNNNEKDLNEGNTISNKDTSFRASYGRGMIVTMFLSLLYPPLAIVGVPLLGLLWALNQVPFVEGQVSEYAGKKKAQAIYYLKKSVGLVKK